MYHLTKMKFSIKDFFSKCDQIRNGKFHFLCSVQRKKESLILRFNSSETLLLSSESWFEILFKCVINVHAAKRETFLLKYVNWGVAQGRRERRAGSARPPPLDLSLFIEQDISDKK